VRYVLRAPTSWAYDMSYILYGALFLMAGAYTLSRNGHVRGDVIYRLLPDRQVVNSMGWSFANVVERRINNEGFFNDQDYDPSDPRPLLALIGDSYVEAKYLPFAESLAGRLLAAAGEEQRVYSFGISGAPLSQYLVWADLARRVYRPSAMVFLIIGNDFDESLARYRVYPGFHHYVAGPDGGLELVRFDFEVGPLRELVRRSALARYLFYNLQITSRLPQLEGLLGLAQSKSFVGNTAAEADPARLAESRRAVDAFLQALPAASGLPAERILFVVDGMRPELYDPGALAAASGSYFAQMREELMAKLARQGYRVADLQPSFLESYRTEGKRFEFAFDNHWNAHGHEIAARAVTGTPLFLELTGRK